MNKAIAMYKLILLLMSLLSVSVYAVGDQVENNHILNLDYPAELAVIKRQQWGWLPITESITNHQISRITIHHGGEDFADDKDPVKYLRALQSWGRSDKGWVDIPYHFMIDRQGRIYETRPINIPGDTNTSYDPAGHALISVMGNYENQQLSAAQLEALIGITAFLAAEFDVALNNIRGHKDYADTACPGADLYRYLQDGTIQARVRAELAQ